MEYSENDPGWDGEIILKAEINMLAIIPNLIIGGGFIMGAIGSMGILFGVDAAVMGAVSFILNFLTGALIILPKFLQIKATELGLTNKRITGEYGLLNTKVMDLPISCINSIDVKQGSAGKIFGYGKIVISTSSGVYKFNYIKNANSFRSAVMEQTDIYDEERVRKQAEQLADAIKQ